MDTYAEAVSDPAGPSCDSVPALLRRLADAIEALGPAEIQDVVIESEMSEYGPWRSGTLYFHLPEESEDARISRISAG